jgi:MFS family permease
MGVMNAPPAPEPVQPKPSQLELPRPQPSAPRTTYRAVFAAAEFRVLFAAFAMYVLGFEFEILGLSVLVYAQTRSPFLTALAFSLGFAPQVVGGALFSSLADRLPPRLVIGSGLVIRAVPGLVIGLLPGLPVPAMLALVAAAASVAPVFSAASSGLLPDVLDGDRYVLGRSVFNLTGSGMQIVGLGIAGAILAVVPARWLLLAAGAALTVAAAVTRLGLRRREARAPGTARREEGTPAFAGRPGRGGNRGVIRATIAGNAELFSDRHIRGLLLVQWLPAWLAAGAESLIVPYTGSLGFPASGAAPLLAAVPAGMLLGEVIAGRFLRPATRRRLAFPLAIGIGLPLLAFWFRPPLPAAVAVLLVSGLGFAYQLGLQQAFLDSLPERLRGQAFGLYSTGAMGGQGLGPVAAGALASAVAPGPVIALAGAGITVTALALRGTLRG